MKQAAFPADSL